MDRVQTVRDENLVPWERCRNSHSDDGWEPQWHRRLVSLNHNPQVQVCVSVQCGSSRARSAQRRRLPRWRRRKEAGVKDACQPIAADLVLWMSRPWRTFLYVKYSRPKCDSGCEVRSSSIFSISNELKTDSLLELSIIQITLDLLYMLTFFFTFFSV